MSRFIAFDVETPNRANNRISAIGITITDGQRIIDEYYSLVDPKTHFDRFNTILTGISSKSVQGAPDFVQLWEKIEPIMSSGILVAHNALFDLRVLHHCLKDHGISWKSKAEYICTVQAGRKLLPNISHKLNDMCRHYGIELDHHQAASDSRACAQILMRYIGQGADADSFIELYDLEKGAKVKKQKSVSK